MSGKSPIQWTDASWNPVVGCKRVSAGCDHCYAFQLHDQRHIAWKRGRFDTAPKQYHVPFSRVQLMPERLEDPLHWRKPRRVFVNSVSDLFHEDVPDEFIMRVFGVMAITPHHTYQILTKRPERMRDWVSKVALETTVDFAGEQGSEIVVNAVLDAGLLMQYAQKRLPEHIQFGARWPLPNVWLGTSVENQKAADERIPLLLETPAAVRFLSCEPLLGPVSLRRVTLSSRGTCNPLKVQEGHYPRSGSVGPLSWVIIGGESGNFARPMEQEWAESLIAQCCDAGIAPFVKQMGTTWAKAHHAHDNHGGTMEDWPEHLRIREYPETQGAA